MMAGKVAKCIKQYGLAHNKSQQLLKVLERFTEGKVDWKCHCSHKNPHYCAVS